MDHRSAEYQATALEHVRCFNRPWASAIIAFVITALTLFAMTQTTPILALYAAKPPIAERRPVTLTLHGETLVDDYSWLRGKEKPDVLDYLNKENAYFDAVMKPTETLQETLYREMLSRVKEDDNTVPTPKNGWLYYSRTEKGKSYPIICRKRLREGEEQVMLDPNKMAEGKPFFSIGSTAVSDDTHLLAYTTDETGYRQYNLQVKDLRTGEVTPNVMERVDSVEWAADNRTLYIVQEDPVSKRSHRLYRLKLGDAEPTLIFQEDDGLFNIFLDKTQDDKYLVFGSASKEENDVSVVASMTPNAKPRQIFGRHKKERYSLEHNGDKFYVRTDKDAKNFRVVSAPESDPTKWTDVVPHDPKVRINSFLMLKDHIAVGDRANGLPGLRVVDLATGKVKRLKFDDATYTAGLSSNMEFDTNKLRYSYASPVKPSQIVELNLKTGAKKVLKQTEAPGYDSSKYTTERVWVTAKDGVKVPIGIVYRKDLQQKDMPTLLYGYGSYGSSATFGFNPNVVSLLDRGYIYAVAQIRGGGRHGGGLVRRRQDVAQDEHLHRFHRLRRLSGVDGSDGPGQAGHHGGQRGRAAHGRGDEPSPGPLQGGVGFGPVCGRYQHDAGRDLAVNYE